MRLILASTSPRRRVLLSLLDLPFAVKAPAFEEVLRPGLEAKRQAEDFARGKARVVADAHSDSLVIGSDTLIDLDHLILGKPHTREEARVMLSRLRARRHRIHTAVALCRAADGIDDVATSTVDVWMRAWSEAEMDDYLNSGESLEKAGGYAIQGRGAGLIERIEGDYTAAVGLPLRTVAILLGKAGCPVPVDVEALYRNRPYANWSRFAG